MKKYQHDKHNKKKQYGTHNLPKIMLRFIISVLFHLFTSKMCITLCVVWQLNISDSLIHVLNGHTYSSAELQKACPGANVMLFSRTSEKKRWDPTAEQQPPWGRNPPLHWALRLRENITINKTAMLSMWEKNLSLLKWCNHILLRKCAQQ